MNEQTESPKRDSKDASKSKTKRIASPEPHEIQRRLASSRIKQLGKEIESLYKLTIEFKFKCLKPWVVL